jgi:hypothetical protein
MNIDKKIKFRFWFKEWEIDEEGNNDGRMLYGDSFAFEDYEPIDDLFSCIQTSIEVMRFTGIEDRNGKEIYEGDVIKTKVTEELFEVTWDYAFLSNIKNFNDRFEVVGNKYENSNLLSLLEP